jgi:glycosyltransferase involved in cell wall biosynthesis
VLALAESANPGWISVPMVGWKHLEAIREFADVHLVTHARNRENVLAAGLPERDATFIETGIDRVAGRLFRASRAAGSLAGTLQTGLTVPGYYAFERRAARLFGEDLARGGYDLVHRVVPLSPGVPSLFASFCRRLRVPFVLGPLNGGVPWPPGFDAERRREGEWAGLLRPAYRLLPYYRRTRRDASAILVGSAPAWLDMPARFRERCFYLPENAIDPRRFARRTRAYGVRPLRGAFAGRFVACKGLELLLEAALPLLRSGQLVLDLMGDGPERGRIERQIAEAGVGGAVRADGWVPHERLQERLSEAALLTFPSIREFGGAAVMEAMLLGLVPVVADYGGPSEIVEDGTGFRVPLAGRAAFVVGLRDTLARACALSTSELAALGEAAHRHINERFTLACKGATTRAVYEWLLGRGPRPSLAPAARSLALYG